LIDSWSWIEYWRGGRHSAKAANHIDGTETALASTVNLAEIYHSLLRDYDEKTAIEKTQTVRKRSFLIPVNEEIAIEAARAKHSLKLSLADSIILATARSHKAKLVSGDKDFKGISDVIYIGD
jgi:predicted nucleic acid-binding protein